MTDTGDAEAPPRRLTARERRQRDAELGIHNLPGENLTVVSVAREPQLLLACDPATVFLSRERREEDGNLHVRARLMPSGQVRVSTLVAVVRDADGNATDLDDRSINVSSANPIELAAELSSFDVRALHEAHDIQLLVEAERDIQELFLSAATGSYSTEAGRHRWPITLEDLPPPHPPIRATLTCFTKVRDNSVVRIDFVLGVLPAFDWVSSLGLDFEFRLVDGSGRPLARETRSSGSLQPNRARVIRARIYDVPIAEMALVRGIEIDVRTRITRWELLGTFVVDRAASTEDPVARALERARAREQLTVGEAHTLLRDAGISMLESEVAALAGERQLESPTAVRQTLSGLSAEAQVLLDVVLDRICYQPL